MTNPATPFVRAIDGLRALDIAFQDSLAGGIVTSIVLPGSGNVMGGEGVAVKSRGKTVEEMLVKDFKRTLKMACGENPKRTYGNKGVLPMSRMGNAWILRSKFQEAQKLIEKQKEWDCNQVGERPNDLALEPLVDLIKGDAILQMHCYEVVDLEMAIRVSKEFGFQITSFHHALEAYKIPQILKENNISVATFADHWGFKMEGYDASVLAPKILHENGVNLVLKTDHPVIHGYKLASEAGKAFHYGLNEVAAIASITSNAAKAAGLFHRLGSIEVGKDADIVVWDRNPLLNGANPTHVFIEGVLEYTYNYPYQSNTPSFIQTPLEVVNGNSNAYSVRDVQIFTMDGEPIQGSINVERGIVTCIGQCTSPNSATEFRVKGGIITPGMIESSSPIGLIEVSSESNTADGSLPSSMYSSNVMAYDGLTTYGRVIDAAFRGGVTIAIVKPQGSRLVMGQSVAYEVATNNNTFIDELLIKNSVALHITIGNSAKGSVNSISGQISQLRNLFASDSTMKRFITNNQTITVNIHKADHIIALLRLKKEMNINNLVIIGGAEAHLVADRIAQAGVPVIITPAYGYAHWETLRSNEYYNADVLVNQGIKVGIAVGGDQAEARNLRFMAGVVKSGGRLNDTQTLEMITSNINDIYQLGDYGRIKVGNKANFVLFNGNPFEFGSQIKLIALGSHVERNPSQY